MQTLDGVVIGDAPLIRVRGLVSREEGPQADAYYASRSLKSRLGAWMRSILALRSPEAGEIRLLGVDGRSRDPVQRRHIERNTGVLFQDGALFSSLTVGENVQVPLKEP